MRYHASLFSLFTVQLMLALLSMTISWLLPVKTCYLGVNYTRFCGCGPICQQIWAMFFLNLQALMQDGSL